MLKLALSQISGVALLAPGARCCAAWFGVWGCVVVSFDAAPTTVVTRSAVWPQALRVRAGSWMYMRINVDELTADEINAGQYLAFKEQLVDGELVNGS